MFHMQLRALWQNLCQLFKGMYEELGLAVIVTGKRMRPLDNPVHVVRHMIEEPFAISRFQISENLVNVSRAQLVSANRSCSRHFNWPPSHILFVSRKSACLDRLTQYGTVTSLVLGVSLCGQIKNIFLAAPVSSSLKFG